MNFVLSLALALATLVPAAEAQEQPTPRRRRPSPTPIVRANRPPAWPQPVKVEMETKNTYDDRGFLATAVTTITITTPPVDPDGDPLTYAWKGQGVGLTTGGLEDFPVKEGDLQVDGLTASWNREIWSGEPASGFLSVTASDGKGGEALHLICIGRHAQCP